jgi:glycerophosphoryl diester phosphodiesterase
MITLLISTLLVSSHALEVQGHRGARWMRPENTLPAFQYAVENGADTLELDMHVTSDDHVVITHDPYLNPKICVDAAGKSIPTNLLVRSMTLKQLQTYDCGTLVNPKFPTQTAVPGTKIPTLDALFDWISKSRLANAKKVRFNIETKSEAEHPEYTPDPDKFVHLFLAVVKRHKMMSRVMLESFDYRTLKIARKLEPKLPLVVLVEDRPGDADSLAKLIKDYDAQILSPQSTWLTELDVKAVHQAGAQVVPWTVNDETEWAKMKTLGVDGIITDNPKGLIDYLSARGPGQKE